MKLFNKRIRHTGRLFTSNKADIAALVIFCNALAEKVDELVKENNRLSEKIDTLVEEMTEGTNESI